MWYFYRLVYRKNVLIDSYSNTIHKNTVLSVENIPGIENIISLYLTE